MLLSRTTMPIKLELPHIRHTLQLWMHSVLLYLLCFVVLYRVIDSTAGFVGNDDYYHARIAAQIIEQGRLRLDFPWLPQTILSTEHFTDHHLLYHLYLAPWVYVGGMAGAKLAQASVVAAIFVALWSLLRAVKVRWATLWSLALFGMSIPFISRVLMIRTQGASLLLLVIALHLLFTRRYRWLVPLAFAYTWLYNGFILLPVFAAAYAVAAWLTERRITWQPVVYSLAGMALGLLINPYFPQNILFSIDHLGAKVDFESGVAVGSEWYPYTTGALIENSLGALLALLAGFLTLRKRDRIEATALFVALIMLAMLFKSRRFIEYFPAFALIFCAVSWGRIDVELKEWLPIPLLRKLALGLVGSVGVLLSLSTLQAAYMNVRDTDDVGYMAGAAAWLEQNTPVGALIFQTDWDDFPYLFYHNTHNTYLVGLDPTYLQIANPPLWDRWVAITRGYVPEPSAVIYNEFHSEYVVSDIYHDDFVEQVRHDASMQLVYRDATSYIWRVIHP